MLALEDALDDMLGAGLGAEALATGLGAGLGAGALVVCCAKRDEVNNRTATTERPESRIKHLVPTVKE